MEIPGYKILEPLGKGGMAQVYLALQESVGRQVAIKLMNASLTPDPQFIERFIAEARCANLNHPNIITVFDAGQAANQPFIVMEYIDGGDLAKRLRQGPLTPAQALSVIRQVAGALHHSHQKGYVHRDVKPENVLFRDDTTVVLADFGIAKALQGTGNMTQTGMIIGSPSYMSPEQVKGEELDGRSDIYSLGVMFYQLLTGTKPYQAEDTYALGYKHINEPIPNFKGDLKLFQPLLASMMAKQKTERIANGLELIRKVDALASTLTAQQVGYPPQLQKTSPFNIALASANISFEANPESEKTLVRPDAKTVAKAAHVSEQKPAKNWLLPVVSVALVLAATVGGFSYFSSHKNTMTEAEKPATQLENNKPTIIPNAATNEIKTEPHAAATTAAETEKPAAQEEVSKPVISSNPATSEIKTEPPATTITPPVTSKVEQKPAVEKPAIKETKIVPDPKQQALAQALKKGNSCLQNRDYVCAEAEAEKALIVDSNNAAAKKIQQQAKQGQSEAKTKFMIQ